MPSVIRTDIRNMLFMELNEASRSSIGHICGPLFKSIRYEIQTRLERGWPSSAGKVEIACRHPQSLKCQQRLTNSLEMSTLLSLIPKPASLTSDTAIVLPGSPPQSNAKKPQDEQEEYSYSDFRSLVLSFRKVLIEQLGVKPSEVIALSMANTVEFVIAFLGTTVSRSVFIRSSYARQN